MPKSSPKYENPIAMTITSKVMKDEVIETSKISNSDAFECFVKGLMWLEQQTGSDSTELMILKQLRDRAAKRRQSCLQSKLPFKPIAMEHQIAELLKQNQELILALQRTRSSSAQKFDIVFRKTADHGNSDFISRLPKTSEELEVKDDITVFQMTQIETLPVTSRELRQETGKDEELGRLSRALR
ncbi:hypothetical protein AVEN_65296-1 [Araneus ventricosus]|uniref:Uncharacterized protein n=1 Tax=Araneus ventricosus TaxID=182803 RepID=A0A4Y2AG11_ARAVE|nr:hypothetical protein AVEN_65296-1 [Araneus ventricosus]